MIKAWCLQTTMSDFMQLFSAKIAFSKTIFSFPDVLLTRPLSPRFGLLITGLPSVITNWNYCDEKFTRYGRYLCCAIFFHLPWYNAVHFKRNAATKTMSILTQKIGEPNGTTFPSVKRLGRKSLCPTQCSFSRKLCSEN